MKQLLFLLLFPCLCVAQYTGNAGQKITLGEQTTADGLVFRGVASIDTVTATSKITRANKQDTSAFILLDTVTNLLWHYKTASNGWIQAGGSVFDTTSIKYVNTYGTQTVNGAKTFTNVVTATRFNPTASTLTGTGMFLPSSNTLAFTTADVNRLQINPNGRVGIGTQTLTGILNIKQVGAELSIATDNNNVYFEGINRENTDGSVDYGFYARNGSHKFWTGAYTERARIINNGTFLIGYTTDQSTGQLQVNGNVSAGGVVLTSDQRFKENITPLTKGLEIINKLKPVTFNFVNDTENNFSKFEEVGFIAQDVDRALSTESFSKSIVKNADDSDIDSKMVMSVYNLIPILTKAIQEQQALIKALEQRILILENK